METFLLLLAGSRLCLMRGLLCWLEPLDPPLLLAAAVDVDENWYTTWKKIIEIKSESHLGKNDLVKVLHHAGKNRLT